MVDNRFELINEDKELVSLCLASQYSREVNLYMDGELHFINVMGSQVGSSNVVNERLETNRGPNIGIDDIEANLVDVRVGGVEVDLVEGSEDSDSGYNVDANDEQIHGDDDGLFMENIDPDVEWEGDGANVTITESEESDDSGSDCGEVDLAESEDDLQSLGGNFSGDEGDNAVGNTTFNPNHFFDPNCEWKVHALKIKDESSFQVRQYHFKHNCGPVYNCKNVNSTWLSKRFEQEFRTEPKRNVKGFKSDVVRDIRCHVSQSQAYRAKWKALKKIEGNPDYQYKQLWDYAGEIQKTNPGSTVIMSTTEGGQQKERKFNRLYICLKSLKDGFMSGCRPLIGVDGCYLKGPKGGILLSVVSVDPNNNVYHVAYAVVSSEMRETWEWFLRLLKEDLQIVRDYEYTLIFDKQKGLIPAVETVLPTIEHRFCVRHLHNNFKNAGFRGQALKFALWKAARQQPCKILQEEWKNWLLLMRKQQHGFMTSPLPTGVDLISVHIQKVTCY
ncbi:UNVERIFIED_CONTAM: hypothetical protein Sangu_1320100 [Sesamum angustifolium]|uniref:MULE transposase domain-containing protein n=1 Tax=Sesamum angustifolium TaxID=2727405 RepID=A0AAW2NK20_9LAMI